MTAGPKMNLSDIKLEDIEFEAVKACKDKKVVLRYIKLLEDDGNYFVDLLNACKEKLLELDPKAYYTKFPRQTTEAELNEATQDLLEWEESVKETDKLLRDAKKDIIFDDSSARVRLPVRGQEPVLARPSLPPKAQKPSDRPSEADPEKSKRAAYARDKSAMKDYYSAWDSMDVDAMEAEVDEKEKAEEESRKAHFNEMKEEQDAANAVSSMAVREDIADGVPQAHRRHMSNTEKEKGNEAFYAKDYDEAEAYYSRSLHFCADDPSTWANRALVRLKLDRPEAALADCEHALAINPRYMKALHRKGKALYDLQRYEGAVKAFQQALAQSPGNAQINGDLMVARRKLRKNHDEPAAPSQFQSRRVDAPSSTVVEELPDDAGPVVQTGAQAAPAPGYTRVQIEEDSDSEDDEAGGMVAGGGSAVAAPPQPVKTQTGFRKVVIQDVSSDEDEPAPTPCPASNSPAAAAPQGGVKVDPAEAASPAPGVATLQSGFRKIQIIDASDSEDEPQQAALPAPNASGSQEAGPSPARPLPSPVAAAPAESCPTENKFRKVIIQDVSESDDDQPLPSTATRGASTADVAPAAASPTASLAASATASATTRAASAVAARREDPISEPPMPNSTRAPAPASACFDEMD